MEETIYETINIDKLSDILNPNSLLTISQKKIINSILENVVADCINNSIYENLKLHQKITFEINPSTTIPAFYNPATNTLTFSGNSNINYENMQEELFHAYQNYQYGGGTSQYTGQQTAGSANIEFEAKLYRDINCLLRSGTCPFAINSQNYKDWLYNITDFGSKYPTSISGTDFNSYIGIWRNINSGYSNTSISSNLSPDAINNLLFNNPCN